MKRTLILLLALPLVAGCRTRTIPKPDAPWMAIGGTHHSLMLLDTSRIVPEGDARVVHLRIDSVAPGRDSLPVVVPSARRETVHRVRCATRTVDDLWTTPAGRAPGPTDVVTTAKDVPFDRHPYGPQVFPTVCGSFVLVARARAAEKE